MVRWTLGLAVAALTASLPLPVSTAADAGNQPSMRVLVRPVDVGERARIRVDVPVPTGVDAPSGVVVVRVTGEGYRVRRTREWSGRDVSFEVPRVEHPGRYVVRASFRSTTDGLEDQFAARVFRVTRR
jgi:hypothetical protein